MSTVIQFVISFAVSLATLIGMLAILEILRRKGFDPIAKLANVFAPGGAA